MFKKTLNNSHFNPATLKLEYGATPDEAIHYWGIPEVEELLVAKKKLSAVHFLMIDKEVLAVIEVLQHDLRRVFGWGSYVICNIAFNTEHPTLDKQRSIIDLSIPPDTDTYIKNPLYATSLNASAVICHVIYNQLANYKMQADDNGVCVNFMNAAAAIGDCQENLKYQLKASTPAIGEYTGYDKLPIVGVDFQRYTKSRNEFMPAQKVVHKRVIPKPGLDGVIRAPSMIIKSEVISRVAEKLLR